MPVTDGSIGCASLPTARTARAAISLSFEGDFTAPVRARISYAFRNFAAIYNHKVVDANTGPPARRCIYTTKTACAHPPDVLVIPARYRISPVPAWVKGLSQYPYAGELIVLTHGVDESTGNPDWLGELFEWLSSSFETAATHLDAVGRIPYSESVFSRGRITPRKPYASLLMAWMENVLCNGNTSQSLPKAPSPIPNVEHFVLCSHDIDFCYTTRTDAFVRLLKNLFIALHPYRSPSFLCDNLRLLLELCRGKRVGDYLPALVQEIEQRGFRSTFFAVARRGHRRDPSYSLEMIAPYLVDAKNRGFSVGLHGSYCSVIDGATLAAEAQVLANAIGNHSFGGRQHWLRFDRPAKLFREVERAGLSFDASLGFAETVGFRSGASFAYPPYDFESESAFPFLEFPLVLMDGSVEAECRTSHEDPQAVADEILGESRKWGWGGVSIIWHNPIEPIQVPRQVNNVFWNLAENRGKYREMWMSSDQFLQHCLSRYQNAGLLGGVAEDA